MNLAFGLGKLVVDGSQTLRFSPRYPPKNVLYLSTPGTGVERDAARDVCVERSPKSSKRRSTTR